MENYMKLQFPAKARNEAFARAAAGAFAAQLDPTCEELADIKTAVSEAVTNAIVHGYAKKSGQVEMVCKIVQEEFIVIIEDSGEGIENIPLAMQPLYSTVPGEERSGMGFTVMESFMDTLDVDSAPGKGTTITMTKRIGQDRYGS
ncbi:MAG: anti-sigma F factor [Clostridia bacterium]|nr:anti-sigma F factor [Clostridia bacterium]